MKKSLKLILAIGMFLAMNVSIGNAANLQPLNPPPADVNDPLYKTPLNSFLPPPPSTLPPVDPAIKAIRDRVKNSVMPVEAAKLHLMHKITPIVGGNVMNHVRGVMINSLSDPTNTTGIAQRIVPFN